MKINRPVPGPTGTRPTRICVSLIFWLLASSGQAAVDLAAAFKPVAVQPSSAAALAVGDLAGDGTDAIATLTRTGGIDVVRRLSDGEWSIRTLSKRPAGVGSALALADFDRDGRLDIVLANDEGLQLRLNRESAYLALSVASSTGAIIGVADVDQDGWVDILSAHASDVRLWRNAGLNERGTLSFEDVTAASGLDSCCHPVDAKFADVDNDGDPDLIVANDGARLSLLINEGAGQFADASSALPAISATGIWAEDFDADGVLDLLVVTGDNAALRLLVNRGADGFTEVTEQSGLAAVGVESVLIDDLDRDGHNDILTRSIGHNRLQLFRGRRGGRFVEQTGLPTAPASAALAVVDVDLDGYPEIVAIDSGVNVLANRPSANRWLGFDLQRHDNQDPRGTAIVVIRKDGSRVSRHRLGVDRAIVGIGQLTQVDFAAVYWPSGNVSRVQIKALNDFFSVTEPDYAASEIAERIIGKPVKFRTNKLLQCR